MNYVDKAPDDPSIKLIPEFLYRRKKHTLVVKEYNEGAELLGTATPDVVFNTNKKTVTGFFVQELRSSALGKAINYLQETVGYKEVKVAYSKAA